MASIANNSTVQTVWSTLTHQECYVKGVLKKMRRCRNECGNAHVRIGITGSGQKPYYRVFSREDDGVDVINGSYYDNHDPLETQDALTSNWSTESMSFQELEDFYADAIGYTGKRPK